MKSMHKWFTLVALATLGFFAQAASPAAPQSGNGIESLMVSKSGGSTVLRLGLRQPMAVSPSSFSIANPARLIFDLQATTNDLGYSTKVLNEGVLKSVNVIQAGDRSRLVLNLDKSVGHEVQLDGKTLLITLNDPADAGGGTPVGTVQRFAGGDRKEGLAIRDIQFRRNKDGAGVVVVDMTASDGGVDLQQKGSSLQVSFKKAKLPEHLRRQMDVVDFATPVTVVKTRPVGEDVSMEIVPKGLWEHIAFQSDNQFVIEVRPVKEDPNKLFQGSKTGFQGEAISLNFQSIPLRELLHVFADITNFNIVVSDSVTGNVSLRLNDVPWDHALQIVLQQKNLSMRKSGNVLWIAPRDELAARDKLEVEARDAAVAAEQPRMEVFQLNYQKAEDFAAMLAASSAAGSTDQTKTASQGGFLSSIGRVTVDKRTNQAFIYDVPSKLELVRDLLKKVDQPARQVLIEARIVEADTSFTKALGVRLGGHDIYGLDKGHAILGNRNARYGVSATSTDAYTHLPERRTISDPSTGYTAYLPGARVTAPTTYLSDTTATREVGAPTIADSQFTNLPIAGAAGQFALSLFNSKKTELLTVELTAREVDGMAKSIASPRILTANQVEAQIQQGFRLPYLQATSSGATSVAYISATLALKVRPQITPDGRVLMVIKINKDKPGAYQPLVGYSVDTKEVSTEVTVENGGTIVIGGIFEETATNSTTRVPFFGDLPYVGFLFKTNTKEEFKKELIIMITPRIADDLTAAKI